MAHIINDECINCGTCEYDCPSKAISEIDGKCFIDAAACDDCGICASVCPVKAAAPI